MTITGEKRRFSIFQKISFLPHFDRRPITLSLLLPLVIYALVICAVTWPLVTQLGTHVISSSVSVTDDVEHLRMIWWVRYALAHGLNPFYQSLFGYPGGFFSTVQWAQPLVYWPPVFLSFVFNVQAAFNLWMLIVLLLNGLSAYWLCLELTSPDERPTPPATAAALIGGLIFMIFPALQGHLQTGQLNIVSNYGLPVAALCLVRILRGRGTLRIALVGMVAIWILMLSNYTGIIFLILPLVLFGGVYWLIFEYRHLKANRRRILGQTAIVFGGAALLSLPFYLPMIADALDSSHSAYLETQGAGWVLFSTDPLSFFAVSPFTPWTKPLAPDFSYTILNSNMTEGTAYLGLIASILAIIAVARQRKAAGLWLVLLIGSAIFSLGPLLKWKEQSVIYTLGLERSNIVLPWALFQNLPLINIIRTPGRFNLMTGLALGVLAALGLKFVLDRIERRTARLALSSILIIAITGEYQLRFPFPTYTVTEPAYFSQLADRPDIRAVFDVPYTDTQKEALLEQMAHHKPIIAGYYARLTPVDPAKLALLSDVARGQAWQVESTLAGFPGVALTPDTARSILKDNGIDVIVYHWALLDKPNVMNWAVQTFGQPAYQDDQIGVFEVPQPVQPPQAVQPSKRLVMTHQDQYWWPFNPPAYGWWPAVFGQPSAASSSQNVWLKGGARIVVYAPESTLQQFTLKLTPLFHAYSLHLMVDNHLALSWDIGLPTDQITFRLALQPGFHTLVFDVPDGCTPIPVVPSCLTAQASHLDGSTDPQCQRPNDQCISMRIDDLQTAQIEIPAQDTNVNLDDGLALRGFRAPDEAQPGGMLLVETDWNAAQKLPGDYHLFMHVFGPDGKLLIQYDGIPGNGAYPTTKWSVPQPWTELTALTVPADAAPGLYEVYAGWYRYPDLLRLGVRSEGKHAADGLVYLKSIAIR